MCKTIQLTGISMFIIVIIIIIITTDGSILNLINRLENIHFVTR